MRTPNYSDAKSTIQLIYQRLSPLGDGQTRIWSVKLKGASTATSQQVEPLTRNWHLVCMLSLSGPEGGREWAARDIRDCTNDESLWRVYYRLVTGLLYPSKYKRNNLDSLLWSLITLKWWQLGDNTSSQLPFCSSSWSRMNLKIRLLIMTFITRAWSATHTIAWWHASWSITIGMRRASRKMSISTILKPCISYLLHMSHGVQMQW